MKRITLALIIVALLFSCNLDESSSSSSTPAISGTLKLTLDKDLSRTIEPTISMEVTGYNITATGPTTDSFSYSNVISGSLTQSNLEIGTWSITLDALNSTGDTIATVTDSFEIEKDLTTELTLVATPLTGTGTLDMTITWPDDLITTPSVTATLTDSVGTSSPLTFTVDTGTRTATYTDSTLNAGYYSLQVNILDDTTNVWGMVEAVRIIQDETATATLALTKSDINEIPLGDLDLTYTVDLDNPIDITIAGNETSFTYGDPDMNVTVTPSETPDSYEWYLNGVLLSGETASTLAIGNSLDVGDYRVDVLLKKDSIISSAYFTFTVMDSVIMRGTVDTTSLSLTDGAYNMMLEIVVSAESFSTSCGGSVNIATDAGTFAFTATSWPSLNASMSFTLWIDSDDDGILDTGENKAEVTGITYDESDDFTIGTTFDTWTVH